MTDWKSKWRTAYSGKWKQPYWYNEENIRTWYNPNDFKSEKDKKKDLRFFTSTEHGILTPLPRKMNCQVYCQLDCQLLVNYIVNYLLPTAPRLLNAI